MTYRELEQRLRADGWVLQRQAGSHKIYAHEKKEQIIVVAGHHSGDQVRKGMLAKIKKQAGW